MSVYELVCDNVEGDSAPALEAFVRAFARGRLDPPSDIRGVETLKLSPFRVVLRLRRAGHTRIVKIYRPHGFRWRRRARAELLALRTARARGIACPEAIAACDSGSAGPSALVLEDLGEGTTLDALHDSPEARASLRAAGELTAQACRAGLDHRDLHLGNLYRDTSGKIWLLDLHAARFRDEPVPVTRGRFRNLYLSLPWPEQRGLREQLFAPLDLPPSPRQLSGWVRKHLNKRVLRCERNSGSFRRCGSVLRRVGIAVDADAWRKELESAEPIKSGRRGRVVRAVFGVGKLRETGTAQRLWRAAHALELRSVPAALGLALLPGTERGGHWIVSEDLSRSGTNLADRVRAGADPTKLEAWARSLGKSLGRLHATGLRCRDSRGDNFQVVEDEVCLVDCDGVVGMRPWGHSRAHAADLGRLLAWARHQTGDGLDEVLPALTRRFLRSYLREWVGFGHTPPLRSLVTKSLLRAQRWQSQHSR